MEAAAVTSNIAEVAVEAGVASGAYRFAACEFEAFDALGWVLDGPTGSLFSDGCVAGIDIETTSLAPDEGRIRLVQIAAGDRCAVLDAFCFDPWPIVCRMFEGRRTLWTAHNAEFEQSWIGRHAGFTLLPMFDTRWVHVRLRSARTGEWRSTDSSLAYVCHELFELPLSKEQRLSDWSAPELTPAQIEYAALDALVLIQLREAMERSAIAAGHEAHVIAALRRAEREARRFARPLELLL